MMKVKAVCVMRTDLRNSDGHKVPKGKLIAQGGHAFVGLITKKFKLEPSDGILYRASIEFVENSAIDTWLYGKFTKVVLAVDSEEELLEILQNAEFAGLNVVDIVDNGETEFGKPTFTCIGIGPDWEDKIDAITGHLRGFS